MKDLKWKRVLLKLSGEALMGDSDFGISPEILKLVANEMAPRVHNSGHWSIEGSSASQFELHVRAITGNLDNNPINFKSSLMFNILSKYPDDNILNDLESHYFHSYDKEERNLRKLGHITITKNSAEQLESILPECLKVLVN